MIIMGADPGLSGAVAFLDTETGALDVHDIPTFTLARNGKAKREINTVELARIIDFAAPKLAVIEQVGASPQMGTSSAFAFGQGYGILKGIVSAYFIETKFVPAATWKRVMRVTSDKDSSRAKATALFPRASSLFARKMDDGRAEASLLARYAADTFVAGA